MIRCWILSLFLLSFIYFFFRFWLCCCCCCGCCIVNNFESANTESERKVPDDFVLMLKIDFDGFKLNQIKIEEQKTKKKTHKEDKIKENRSKIAHGAAKQRAFLHTYHRAIWFYEAGRYVPNQLGIRMVSQFPVSYVDLQQSTLNSFSGFFSFRNFKTEYSKRLRSRGIWFFLLLLLLLNTCRYFGA